jgi:flagellar M-ring protein FliF
MDSELTKTSSNTPSNHAPNLLARLSLAQKLGAILGLAALLATFAATLMWSQAPTFKVLFSNLSDRDGGAVIASLTQLNVPYKMTEGGAAIMVPMEQVHDLRLRLASQGLPKGSAVGFELLENQKFGITQFQERMNYQRGLEGELARSIQSLAAVSNARVHLAMPAQSGFFRDQQKPSASVVLTLNSGHSLDRGKIAGIVHLVASSVHELAPKQVSVIDQTGNLLSAEGDSQSSHDAALLQHTRQVENTHTLRIVELLEPIVGKGNVRAQVSAELDFTQIESTAEQYKPNQSNEQAAIRSQHVSEGTGPSTNNSPASGIPGALSNQPQPNPTSPINAPAQTLAAAQTSATTPGANGTTPRQRDATTNYEVDKTVRVTRNPSGTTKRLSAAIVINDIKKTDAEGKITSTPVPPEQLAQLTTLVKDAVGFNKDRGDSVSLINVSFRPDVQPKDPESPIWKDPALLSIAKEVGKYTGLLMIAFIIISRVIKPIIRTLQTPEPELGLNTVVDDQLKLGSMTNDGTTNDKAQAAALERIMLEARQDPAAVANVVKTWVAN